MNAKQTAPLIPALATAAVVAPPILIGAAIGLGLIWLFSNKEKSEEKPTAIEETSPQPETNPIQSPEIVAEFSPAETDLPQIMARRITRDDLAEALEYGERQLTRKEAVIALQESGFQKTAAYKALAKNSKFSSLMEFTPDGLIEWKG